MSHAPDLALHHTDQPILTPVEKPFGTKQELPFNLGGEISDVTVDHVRPFKDDTEDETTRHFEGRALFIGDLASTATESDVWAAFHQIGEIHAVDIKKDRQTGANRGYGFVVYKRPCDAEEAKRVLQNTTIKGREIRIGWAQKNARLFVAILPNELSEKAFAELMERYGPINHSDTHISSHNFGFVAYQHRNDAERVRSILDSSFLRFKMQDGRSMRVKVRVGWGDEQTQRNCVHVQFDPKQAQQANINENDLREMFSKYGCVVKASTPRHSNFFLKGYGFVHFLDSPEGEICTTNAILALDGISVRGVVWKCNFGKRKRERKSQESKTQVRRNRKVSKHPPQKVQVSEQRASLMHTQPMYLPFHDANMYLHNPIPHFNRSVDFLQQFVNDSQMYQHIMTPMAQPFVPNLMSLPVRSPSPDLNRLSLVTPPPPTVQLPVQPHLMRFVPSPTPMDRRGSPAGVHSPLVMRMYACSRTADASVE